MLTKSIIQQRIKEHKNQFTRMGVEKIGIFGSYVRQEQKEESDLDILISFQQERISFNNYMDICYFIDDIFQEVKTEVVTENALSPYIAPTILNEVEYV